MDCGLCIVDGSGRHKYNGLQLCQVEAEKAALMKIYINISETAARIYRSMRYKIAPDFPRWVAVNKPAETREFLLPRQAEGT